MKQLAVKLSFILNQANKIEGYALHIYSLHKSSLCSYP